MRDDEEVNLHSLDGEWIQKTDFQMLGLGNKIDSGNNYQEKKELLWGEKSSKSDCGYVEFEMPMGHLSGL